MNRDSAISEHWPSREQFRMAAQRLTDELRDAAVKLLAGGVAPAGLELSSRTFHGSLDSAAIQWLDPAVVGAPSSRRNWRDICRVADLYRSSWLHWNTACEAVGMLSTADTAAQPALQHCQTVAKHIQDQWSSEPVSTLRLQGLLRELGPFEDHPVTALWQLTCKSDQLDDVRWDHCVQLVETHFGRALAIAVQRRRLDLTRSETKSDVPLAERLDEARAELSTGQPTGRPALPLAPPPATPSESHPARQRVEPAALPMVANTGPATVELARSAGASGFATRESQAKTIDRARPAESAPPDRLPAADGLGVLARRAVPTAESGLNNPQPRATASEETSSSLFDEIGVSQVDVEPPRHDAPFKRFGTTGVPSNAATRPVGMPSSLVAQSLPAQSMPSQSLPAPSLSAKVGSSEAQPTVPSLPIEIADLARAALRVGNGQRRLKVQELVLHLIRAERWELAALLARRNETPSSAGGVKLPAGLLRCLTLSRALRFSRGEVARHIEHELRDLGPWNAADVPATAQCAVALFWRAAAMPAALLGASASAGAVLRAFKIEARFTQLYNFCNRVTALGERWQQHPGGLWSPAGSASTWDVEAQQLQQAIADWLAETRQLGPRYARSSPLYVHGHWSITASAAQRSPSAILNWSLWQDLHHRAQLLMQSLQAPDAVDHLVRQNLRLLENAVQDASALSGASGPRLTSPARSHLLQAIDLATEWRRLMACQPHRTETSAQDDTASLRSEILGRIPGVLGELSALAAGNTDLLLSTAIDVCRTAVERVRQFCSGEVTGSIRDEDPKCLLWAELLRIPHLELNDAWEPLANDVDVEVSLLEHLAGGVRTWQAAFELQSALGDHLATQRLLDLPDGPGGSRAELSAVRAVRLEECRQQTLLEIDRLLQQLESTEPTTADLAEDWNDLRRRAERLRVAIPRLLRFEPVRDQLRQLQIAWQRYRVAVTQPAADSDRPAYSPTLAEMADRTVIGSAGASPVSRKPERPEPKRAEPERLEQPAADHERIVPATVNAASGTPVDLPSNVWEA
jgi:hypothetical protein